MMSVMANIGAIPLSRAEKAVSPPSVPSIAVRDVIKTYGGRRVVEDVSFTVPRGSFISLLGPSGSGKTTILRMIAGFTSPTSGDILINDQSVTKTPPHKRSIGVVFQSLALFPHMSVAQNVAYPLKCRRFDRREIPDRVSEYLKLVRLAGFEDRRIDQLSGGQRQRVAIARALVYKPDILLLDEPLAALDKKLREEIQQELRRIQSELRVTTINVTHDQREALVMSDEIIVLDGGRLQQKGMPSVIYERPSNRFVASFIGHTNVVTGDLLSLEDGIMTLNIGEAEVRAHAPLTHLPLWTVPMECSLRAERIQIAHEAAHLRSADAVLPARVTSVAYEGDRILYEVAIGAEQKRLKIIKHELAEAIREGEPVFIGWNTADLVALNRYGNA